MAVMMMVTGIDDCNTASIMVVWLMPMTIRFIGTQQQQPEIAAMWAVPVWWASMLDGNNCSSI